jgi:hypothetical protein
MASGFLRSLCLKLFSAIFLPNVRICNSKIIWTCYDKKDDINDIDMLFISWNKIFCNVALTIICLFYWLNSLQDTCSLVYGQTQYLPFLDFIIIYRLVGLSFI